MGTTQDIPIVLEPLRAFLHGQAGILRLLLAIGILHAIEGLVVLGLCLWSQMPLEVTIQYVTMTMILGFSCVKTCAKASFRRVHQLQATQDIKVG